MDVGPRKLVLDAAVILVPGLLVLASAGLAGWDPAARHFLVHFGDTTNVDAPNGGEERALPGVVLQTVGSATARAPLVVGETNVTRVLVDLRWDGAAALVADARVRLLDPDGRVRDETIAGSRGTVLEGATDCAPLGYGWTARDPRDVPLPAPCYAALGVWTVEARALGAPEGTRGILTGEARAVLSGAPVVEAIR